MTEQTQTRNFDQFQGYQAMNLTSYYESGRGVTTPVWFVRFDGKIYAYSVSTAYKVKRIRATSDVEIAPADMRGKALGPAVKARARILDESETNLVAQIQAALTKKYGIQYRVLTFLARFRKTPRAYIEVEIASA